MKGSERQVPSKGNHRSQPVDRPSSAHGKPELRPQPDPHISKNIDPVRLTACNFTVIFEVIRSVF